LTGTRDSRRRRRRIQDRIPTCKRIQGKNSHSVKHRYRAPGFSPVVRTIPVVRCVRRRAGPEGARARVARYTPEFSGSFRRLNRGEDPHAALAAGALHHIQSPHALHQFGPRIVSPMPSGSRLRRRRFGGSPAGGVWLHVTPRTLSSALSRHSPSASTLIECVSGLDSSIWRGSGFLAKHRSGPTEIRRSREFHPGTFKSCGSERGILS